MGAGNVGGGLGAALAAAGHDVTYGVRDPDSEKTKAALAASGGAGAGSPAEAVRDADVVIFALRWDAVADTAGQLPTLDGRVVIDAMNRFDGDPARSTAEDLAAMLPGARLVKAFNTIGFENFTTAKQRREKAAMFICGDDDEAKRVAAQLAAGLGSRISAGGRRRAEQRQAPRGDGQDLAGTRRAAWPLDRLRPL